MMALLQGPEIAGAAVESLRAWLATDDGQKLLNTVLGGAILFFGGLALRLAYNRVLVMARYRDCYGEFFLYHPPLIPGINDLPRVSKLVMSRGLLTPGRARQLNVKPRHTVNRGTFTRESASFFFRMVSAPDECPKGIVLWEFQTRAGTRRRVAFGTMCSTNYRREPYHAPIVVSEGPLPRKTVEEALSLMMGTTITMDIRRRLMEMMDRCGDGSPDEEFEHITSRVGPIGRDVPLLDALGAWMAARRARLGGRAPAGRDAAPPSPDASDGGGSAAA
jgi:hypothetical protein